jgi:hypothetical protein
LRAITSPRGCRGRSLLIIRGNDCSAPLPRFAPPEIRKTAPPSAELHPISATETRVRVVLR